jgi:hypothetical protein
MEAAASLFGLMGLVAFARVEKLVKTLKEKGILEEDYQGRIRPLQARNPAGAP